MPRRALIIDKDAVFADQLVAALEPYGFETEMSATGREGIEQAKASHPDLIVLCVELDDTSGYSICAKMKKNPALKEIPLVITSEKATQETFDHHKKLKTRAQVYLMKPFAPELLVEELKQVAELRPIMDVAVGAPHDTPPNGVGVAHGQGEMPMIQGVPYDEDHHPHLHDQAHLEAPMVADGLEDEGLLEAGAELDAALASLSDEPPPLPEELGIEGVAGLPIDYDEDDIRTTIGEVPSSEDSKEASPAAPPRAESTEGIERQELVRRLKEAERARDEAVAGERATQAQLQALSEGASQLPANTGASRDVLAIKKELNAKERELLELRENLQQRDRQLLDAREREAELEEKVVQTEDARVQADRARIDAEGRIAGAEARAEEIERSSRAAIEDRDHQLEDAHGKIAQLEQDLTQSRDEVAGLRYDVATRDQGISERDESIRGFEAAVAERDDQIAQLTSQLEQSRSEAGNLHAELNATRSDLSSTRSDLEVKRSEAARLDGELEEARAELEALRGALADTEDRLASSIRRIREDEDIRSKARRAIEITLNLLNEADYAPEEAPESDNGPTIEPPALDGDGPAPTPN